MTINTAVDGAKLSVALQGRLDTTTAPALEKELAQYADSTEVLLDFAALDYISSAGLRVLLAEQKQMNAKKGKMIIRNVNETIMEVLQITGFVDILTIE